MSEESEQWRALSDDDLAERTFDYGGSNLQKAQAEMARRLLVALGEFKSAADRASSRLLNATRVIAALTFVLVVLTIVLAVRGD